MNLLVAGAGGGLGRELVHQALSQLPLLGHGRLLLFMGTRDVCAPKRGTVTLRDYLAGVASPT